MTEPTKKALKSVLVIIVTIAMVALYVLPGLIPQQARTPTPEDAFTGPVGTPSVQGPTAPPGQ